MRESFRLVFGTSAIKAKSIAIIVVNWFELDVRRSPGYATAM